MQIINCLQEKSNPCQQKNNNNNKKNQITINDKMIKIFNNNL